MDDFNGSEIYKQIFNFASGSGNRIKSRESSWLEFKESFNWANRTKYARSIAAFANTKGGYLVFGVKNSPRDLVGLSSEDFENLDEQIITQYLNALFSPEIIYEKFTIPVKGKNVGILYVGECQDKPVVSVKTDGEVIKEGEIYYRYNARTEKIKYPELKAILERIKEDEKKRWMMLFEKVGKIGSESTAVLNTLTGELHSPGHPLILDERLVKKLKFVKQGTFAEGGAPTLKLVGEVQAQPVIAQRTDKSTVIKEFRLTEDPSAPAIQVREDKMLEQFPLDYHQLTEKLSERYTNFKVHKKYHKIRKQLSADPMLCWKRHLNPRNPDAGTKLFFSNNIVDKFDEIYNKKSV